VFNSRFGRHVATINTEAAPIGIASIPDKDKEYIVTSGADMTLSTFSLDDPNPKRRYKVVSTWATPGVQMALTYANDSRLLYSGATNGNIYSWNVQKRSLVTTLTGHSDIVMNLIILQKLNNIASASLDKTLGVWDSHTNQEILRLHGHKKGVFDLTYTPDYRLIFSCGFEHDACVWSPFVKSLVYRLKGHHACLVGVQSVPNSPEVITADTSGVFKLWDIRNFQCVQTFSANLSGQDTKDSSKLTCFFHTKLPSSNPQQKEDDSRIFAASKMLFSFDQARVVHEATTDYSNVFWMTWNPDSLLIITASERNVIVWDALVGSKMYT
jgi:WD40 repeat protein